VTDVFVPGGLGGRGHREDVRSGSARVVELGPLEHDELTALLEAHADASLPAAVTDAIVASSERVPERTRSRQRAGTSSARAATTACRPREQ
jgi:hypothetical protein